MGRLGCFFGGGGGLMSDESSVWESMVPNAQEAD